MAVKFHFTLLVLLLAGLAVLTANAQEQPNQSPNPTTFKFSDLGEAFRNNTNANARASNRERENAEFGVFKVSRSNDQLPIPYEDCPPILPPSTDEKQIIFVPVALILIIPKFDYRDSENINKIRQLTNAWREKVNAEFEKEVGGRKIWVAKQLDDNGNTIQSTVAHVCIRAVYVIYGSNDDGERLLKKIEQTTNEPNHPARVNFRFWEVIGSRVAEGSGAAKNAVLGLKFPGNKFGLAATARIPNNGRTMGFRGVFHTTGSGIINNSTSIGAIASAGQYFPHELAHTEGYSHAGNSGNPDFVSDAGPLKEERLNGFYSRLAETIETPQ